MAIANEQNLIPNSERSREELREQTRKGGINSGKARRRKADLRRIAQAVLDGSYTDKKGNNITGEEIVLNGLITNLTDPKGKNWGKAVDLLIQLTGAAKSKEEVKVLKAQAALIQAKADMISNVDTSTLDKLDDILREMQQNAKNEKESE